MADHLAKLCKIFETAIVGGDAKKIVEIGAAIEFVRGLKESEDKMRAEILYWKNVLNRRGEKWGIRRIAKTVGWPEKQSQDGFSRLRRLCLDLGFPLAASRQISKAPEA